MPCVERRRHQFIAHRAYPRRRSPHWCVRVHRGYDHFLALTGDTLQGHVLAVDMPAIAPHTQRSATRATPRRGHELKWTALSVGVLRAAWTMTTPIATASRQRGVGHRLAHPPSNETTIVPRPTTVTRASMRRMLEQMLPSGCSDARRATVRRHTRSV